MQSTQNLYTWSSENGKNTKEKEKKEEERNKEPTSIHKINERKSDTRVRQYPKRSRVGFMG